MKRKKIRPDELPELIQALDNGGSNERCKALRLLCPCRSHVQDREVWRRVFQALESHDANVRREAAHAVGTLKLVYDACAQELLDEFERGVSARARALLIEQDYQHLSEHLYPDSVEHLGEQIHAENLPKVLHALSNGDAEEQCRALRLLCPCRNPIYDREIWGRIFRARQGEDGEVRHQAEHAIQTLRERAQYDPRSLKLLMDLEQRDGMDLGGAVANIASWGPRSRPSRRKRMTPCKTGRVKAMASMRFASLKQSEDDLFA